MAKTISKQTAVKIRMGVSPPEHLKPPNTAGLGFRSVSAFRQKREKDQTDRPAESCLLEMLHPFWMVLEKHPTCLGHPAN